MSYIEHFVTPSVRYVIRSGSVDEEDLLQQVATTQRQLRAAPEDDQDDLIHKHKHTEKYHKTILEVSYTTEYKLMDYLVRESDQDQESGGLQIMIDTRRGTGSPFDSAIWIALTAMLSACLCSFLMIVNGWFVEEEPPDEGPPRPVRRRLTREQIRDRYPIWRFDGERLHPVTHPDLTPPEPADLELCSICLDEYEPGDKLRVLDCDHAFHAKCIGKWLSERSAVCPLCKEDLYIDEEESEDESEDDSVEADAERISGWSWLLRWTGQIAEATEEENDIVEETGDVVVEDDTPVEDQRRRRGWRSLWSSLFQPPAGENSLAEPLLLSPDGDNEPVTEGPQDIEMGSEPDGSEEPVAEEPPAVSDVPEEREIPTETDSESQQPETTPPDAATAEGNTLATQSSDTA